MAAGLREHDRYAVSEYVQAVLDLSPYPSDFPVERSAGYVPESALLAVEWYLPPVEVIPRREPFDTSRHARWWSQPPGRCRRFGRSTRVSLPSLPSGRYVRSSGPRLKK
jgi:hypothetical protein